MPFESNFSKTDKNKKSSIPRVVTSTDPEAHNLYGTTMYRTYLENEPVLPAFLKTRLHELFLQIEKEFEILYTENITLHDKIETLNEKLEKEVINIDKQNDLIDLESSSLKTNYSKPKMLGSQKVKTAYKLKAQTSKIVSSFKGPTVNCSVVHEYTGHKDGVWQVAIARPGQPLIGTASADHSACIWDVDSGKCLLQYLGHTGSVNSISFHPTKDLVLTASGDQMAHIWQAVVNWDQLANHLSEEDGDVERDEYNDDFNFFEGSPTLRTPVKELIGHCGVVVAADWLPSGDQLVTASWDRTASLYDVETGELVQCLGGHDLELTHISVHPVQRLVVTSSKDTTFRLWDFREPIHSVSVFQGHTDTVSSAVFTKEDKVVSGSDDRSVKVWDMRNMRSPLATIRSDSAVNRIAVSPTGVIAIPYDNRQVRLFDLNGQRIVRLPRSNKQGHQRMVSSVAWADESTNMSCNFFSCGFDRLIIGWSVQSCSKDM